MGSHQDRSAHMCMHLLERFHQGLGIGAVQCACWFICQDECRLGDNGPCTGGILALDNGQLLRMGREDAGDSQYFCDAVKLFPNDTGIFTLEKKRKGDVFFNGHRVKEIIIPENEPEPVAAQCSQTIFLLIGNTDPTNKDFAGAGAVNRCDNIQLVLFPEAEAPRIAVNSPRATRKLTQSSALIIKFVLI